MLKVSQNKRNLKNYRFFPGQPGRPGPETNLLDVTGAGGTTAGSLYHHSSWIAKASGNREGEGEMITTTAIVPGTFQQANDLPTTQPTVSKHRRMNVHTTLS